MCRTFEKFGDHYFNIPHGRNLSSVFWLIFLSPVPHMKASMEFKVPTDWTGWGVAVGSDTEGLEFLSRPCERVPLYRISWVKCLSVLPAPILWTWPESDTLSGCDFLSQSFLKGKAQIWAKRKKKNANTLEHFLSIKGYHEGREMVFWNGMDIAAKRIRGKTFAFSCHQQTN